MHELSIATSLIEVVTTHLIESGAAGVKSITVEIGDLSGVVPAALLSAFMVARQSEKGLEQAELIIWPVAVEVACSICSKSQPAMSVSNLRCSRCLTPCVNVVRGRELEVVTIEVIDAATDA